MSIPPVNNFPLAEKNYNNDGMLQSLENLYCFHSGFKPCEVLKKRLLKLSKQHSQAELLMLISRLGNHNIHYRLPDIADELTNNETYFFRDEIQFNCLQRYILPALIEKKQRSGDKTLRLWSAACSSGEEAYSLAMIAVAVMLEKGLAEFNAEGGINWKDGWKVKVFGSDINNAAISKAKSARYKHCGLSSFRDYPVQFKHYIKPDYEDSYYSVKPMIQSIANFEVFNLNSDLVPLSLKNMDVVFCRNVMIYWHQKAQDKIIKNIFTALNEHGSLLMSAVDKMRQSEMFSEQRYAEHTVYQRR